MEEVEAKYRVAGPEALAALRERLVALGAVYHRTVAELNVLFDTPDGRLRAADSVLRLRWLADAPGAVLTYKGLARWESGLKRREEHSTPVGDGAAMEVILASLGYRPGVRYTKQRETWQYAGAEVALDTLEFGTYCEVEGTAPTIQAIATALGLSPAQLEPRPYPALAEDHARRTASAGGPEEHER